VRRAGPLLSLLVACALAGVLAALAAADNGVPPPTVPTVTVPTVTVPTTGTTATETTPTTPASVLPPGVTIGGVNVGGLTPADATAAVQQSFEAPVSLRYRRTRIMIAPELLGATARVDRAVARALTAAPNTAVPLSVNVSRDQVLAFLAKVALRFDREAVDSRLLFRNLHPVITRSQRGVRLDVKAAATAVAVQLTANRRATIVLKAKPVEPAVSEKSFGSIIVIRRTSNRLYLYDGMRVERIFGVATGQSTYPTPLGRFTIVVKWRNPWWYPPASPWAKGAKPIPPGPGNPLGTRWMGLSAPGVGIHGTPDAASIGYSASHGCIRMLIPQAEWLFNHVEIGTPVFIVAA
jgi:lipoprotein-anchoring transpeptidase ErfK/SrfK